jgi:hypothetical protein
MAGDFVRSHFLSLCVFNFLWTSQLKTTDCDLLMIENLSELLRESSMKQ